MSKDKGSRETDRKSLKGDRLSADNAVDLATHDDLSTCDHSRDLSFLADDQLGRLHVTFDLAGRLRYRQVSIFGLLLLMNGRVDLGGQQGRSVARERLH